MIDLCMLTCNRARITELCIRSLARRTETNYRLTVLDNGSEDDTWGMLNSLEYQGLVHRVAISVNYGNVTNNEPLNRGVHWGFNALLDKAESFPYYICTDPDIIPMNTDPDWLAQLVDLADRHPEYAAIALRPHVMIGDNVARMFEHAPEVVERDHVGAVLRLMRVEAVRDVGGWKRDYVKPSRNNEEWYICGKLRKAGWKVGYARDIYAIHLFGDPDEGEDPWGYPQGVEHGHVDRWPPVNHYSWERMGIDWEACQ